MYTALGSSAGLLYNQVATCRWLIFRSATSCISSCREQRCCHSHIQKSTSFCQDKVPLTSKNPGKTHRDHPVVPADSRPCWGSTGILLAGLLHCATLPRFAANLLFWPGSWGSPGNCLCCLAWNLVPCPFGDRALTASGRMASVEPER